MAKPKFDPQWAQAKTVCRLNMQDIRMAKQLGLSPKTLMKNNPSPTQRWKLPVKHWIRELYEKRFPLQPPLRPSTQVAISASQEEAFEEDVPF